MGTCGHVWEPLLDNETGWDYMGPTVKENRMETVRIQGRDVPYQTMSVPVADLLLDSKNPRVQQLVGARALTITQQELEDLLWERDAVKALKEDILQNGGVREPLLVVRLKDERLVAWEGNCRITSVRHILRDHFPDDPRFVCVPCWVFNEGDITEEDIAVVLTEIHVASKIAWPAFEQARLVHELHNKYGKPFDWLCSHLRLGRSKITQYMQAYDATTNYINAHPDPQNVRKFSLFHELMKKAELRDRFLTDPTFRQAFHAWITDGKISDSKQVRDLPRILPDKKATEILGKEGYDAAMEVLISQDPALEGGLYSAVKLATTALRSASIEDIGEVTKTPAKLIMLRNLKRALEDLATHAGAQI